MGRSHAHVQDEALGVATVQRADESAQEAPDLATTVQEELRWRPMPPRRACWARAPVAR